MSKRLELHEILCEILGSRHVYFQPPETIKLVYPCIIYNKESKLNSYADDLKYKSAQRYSVTLIDKRPESPISEKIEDLKYCSSDRSYKAENLYHEVYTLFY